jgi:hypothetical protein
VNRTLLVLAAAAIVGPSLRALLAKETGVPPDQNVLFGATLLLAGSIAVGGVVATRDGLRECGPGRIDRWSRRCLILAAVSMLGYEALFRICVVSSFDELGPIYFPLWTCGQAAEMIIRAGGRFAAIERYGPAAVVGALQHLVGLMLFTNSLLLILYLATWTPVSAVLATWAVRGQTSWRRLANIKSGRSITDQAADVFLCHNSEDKPLVREISANLERLGVRTWLDNSALRPGDPWPELLEFQVQSVKSAAVFLGPHGVGKWQRVEINALLDEFVHRRCRIVPVLLPGTSDSVIPIFLRQFNWVDLRITGPEGMSNLASAIRTEPVGN